MIKLKHSILLLKTCNAVQSFLSGFMVIITLFFMPLAQANQSSITTATGSACKTGKQNVIATESLALLNAKRQAVEFASTHIIVQSKVSNFKLEKDVIKSFAEADVKVLSIIKKSWDAKQQCYVIDITAEVIPVLSILTDNSLLLMNTPTAPLTVKVWTDRAEYKRGEYMTIYLKGNKPFYGRLVYKDASGNLLQILPNPNRNATYFNGAVVYQIPDREDAFELLVEPPYGEEILTLYASTAPLGKINKVNMGAVYKITESIKKVAYKTRGIRLVTSERNYDGVLQRKNKLVEFDESSVVALIKKNE